MKEARDIHLSPKTGAISPEMGAIKRIRIRDTSKGEGYGRNKNEKGQEQYLIDKRISQLLLMGETPIF